MRIMGIDYGDKRVGIALSDPLGLMAQGLKTLPNKVYDKMLDSICQIIKENDVNLIVLGLPKNMNGTLGERGVITENFASDIKQRLNDIRIVFWDERLSTVEAHSFLNATNTRGDKRKSIIDTLSAQIILQSYLDSPKFKQKGEF